MALNPSPATARQRSLLVSWRLVRRALLLLACGRPLQAEYASDIMYRARACMLSGGRLDFFGKYAALEPRCLYSCPEGSEEVGSSCVAHEVSGLNREIALTLHVPCASCVADEGMNVAAQLWFAVARLLRVPLTETVASVLIMSASHRAEHPLEHFTLQRTGQAPLLGPAGSARPGPDVGRWDFYMAVRIHTSRIEGVNADLQDTLQQDAAPLSKVLGVSGGVYIFEAAEKLAPQAISMSGLQSSYKVRGLDWNEQPADDEDLVPTTTVVLTTSAALRGSIAQATTTPATPTSPLPQAATSPAEVLCYCQTWRLGDGTCDIACYNKACAYGDCAELGAATTTIWLESDPTVDLSEVQSIPGSLTVTVTGEDKDYNLNGFQGLYIHSPLPGNPDVFHQVEGVTDVYWRADQSRWRFGPRSCADPSELSFGCGSWYLEVPNGSKQKYSSNLHANGLTFDWHQPSTSPLPSGWVSARTSTTMLRSQAPAGASHSSANLVTLSVEAGSEDSTGSTWRVIASKPPDTMASWYADDNGMMREEASSSETPVWLLGIGVTLLLCLVLIVCYFARRRGPLGTADEVFVDVHFEKKQQQQQQQQQQQKQHHNSSFGWGHPRGHSKDSCGSTASCASFETTSTDSGSTASPAAFTSVRTGDIGGLGTPTGRWAGQREPKVHPEPEPGMANVRNNKGGWRPSSGQPSRTSTQHGPESPAGSSSMPPSPSAASGPSSARRAQSEPPSVSPSPARGAFRNSAKDAFAAMRERVAKAAAETASAAAQQAAEDEAEWHRKVTAKEEELKKDKDETEAEQERWRHVRAREEAEARQQQRARQASEAREKRMKEEEARARQHEGEEGSAARQWAKQERKRKKAEEARGKQAEQDAESRRFRSASAPPSPSRNEPPPRSPQGASTPPPRAGTSAGWGFGASPPRQPQGASTPPPRAGTSAGPGPTTSPKSKGKPGSRFPFFGRGGAGSGAAAGPSGPAPKKGGGQTKSNGRQDPSKAAEPLFADMKQKIDAARRESLDVRKKVFKELQRHLHPDKNLQNPEAAKLAFQALMELRGPFLSP